jgi:transcriptional regulator with XRE-family HTH domain
MYQRRLKQNMSRADLAHAIRHASRGLIKATERGIRGWEKNEYVPSGESVPAIAEALGCDIGDLYERNGAAADEDEEAASMGLTGGQRDLLAALATALEPFKRVRERATA